MNIKWNCEEQHMKIHHHGDLPYLYFQKIEETGIVKHGFSTRLGGVSEGYFKSLNLSFTRGDDPDAVMENYRRIASALNVDVNKMVASDQTHTTNIRLVTEQDAGKGIIKPKDYKDIDGLITNIPGLTLATFYADCVPLYFVDPVHKAVGLSHSGWRGTVSKMGKVTLDAMQEAFGTNPEEVIAAIGPSICQDCYEVSEDVIDAFKEALPGKEDIYRKGRLTEEGQKYQLDLWKANQYILIDAGILPENIAMPGICTCCNPDVLFSHRASCGKRGNLAAFLAIKE